MRRRCVALACAVLLSACSTACSESGNGADPQATHVGLPQGVAAKVGNDAIAVRTVARIAEAQHVSLQVARELASRDAAFAAAARSAFVGGPIVPVVERAAWARALLETFKADATARGVPTDSEIAELTTAHWQDFDRPETVRTTHAIALVANPAQDASARAIAQQLYTAVRGITDPEQFIRTAQAVPHEGIEVRAERLPALTRDGRAYFPEGAPPELAAQRFDSDFAEAAHRLAVGQISEPTKSVFGYHVILCEARLAEHHVPLDERRQLLRDEVLKGRAERAKQELLGRLSAATPILLARSIDDLTARVQVTE